jgi:hypothetical protein
MVVSPRESLNFWMDSGEVTSTSAEWAFFACSARSPSPVSRSTAYTVYPYLERHFVDSCRGSACLAEACLTSSTSMLAKAWAMPEFAPVTTAVGMMAIDVRQERRVMDDKGSQ